MGAAEVVAVLRANTSEFTAKIGEAEAQVTKLSRSGAGNFEKMAAVGKIATLAVAGGILAAGVAAVDLGLKAQNVDAQLRNAFKNAGTTTDAYKAQIAGVDAQLTKYGFTNDETNTALARLVTVTGNARQSLKDMGLAADIARNRHIDLNSAADLLAKTMAGNVTAAKRMGIEIPPEILKIKDPLTKANDITAILEGRFKGSAAAAAGTFSGRMEVLKAQALNFGANIGQKLIPILEKLVTQITQVVQWFERHKAIAEAVGVAILTLVSVAIAAYIASMVTAAAATIAATWPLLLIVAVVAAVGVAIFELATHWGQVWKDIKNWIADGAAWIREHFYLIMAIPVVGWMLILAANWKGIWNDIKAVLSAAWGFIQPIFDFIRHYIVDGIKGDIIILQTAWSIVWPIISGAVKTAWNDVIKPIWDFIHTYIITGIQGDIIILKGAWNTAWSAISGAVGTAWNIMKPIIDTITGAISGVESAFNWLTGGGGPAAKASAVGSAGAAIAGHKAAGGPVSGGSTYLVGERGPELFTPSGSGSITPNNALGGGNQPINVTLQIDGDTLAQVMLTKQLRMKRTGGYGTLGLA